MKLDQHPLLSMTVLKLVGINSQTKYGNVLQHLQKAHICNLKHLKTRSATSFLNS
jgi:hypothetical protein